MKVEAVEYTSSNRENEGVGDGLGILDMRTCCMQTSAAPRHCTGILKGRTEAEVLEGLAFLRRHCTVRARALHKRAVNQEHPQTETLQKPSGLSADHFVNTQSAAVKGILFACQQPSLCSWSRVRRNTTGCHIHHTRQITYVMAVLVHCSRNTSAGHCEAPSG